MFSLSFGPFLSPTCARMHASPRSRARTRKPALQCAAQEPLTVPVPDCDRCRSTGCLRRGHLPPPVTAPIPAAQPDPFPPLNFRNVRRFLFRAPIQRVFFYRVNRFLKSRALLDFQLGAWWHGYLWQDWKVALRQGAWAQTLKAFYNQMAVFNMKAGESPVEWEARKAPRISRCWKGKATRRKSWSVRRTALRRTEGKDWWDNMGK